MGLELKRGEKYMVHTLKQIGGTLGGVGAGMGGFFSGIAPVPIYGALIKHGAKPVSGALKMAGRKVGGKTRTKKRIAKRKAKKKR